jgi:hypothetical protein
MTCLFSDPGPRLFRFHTLYFILYPFRRPRSRQFSPPRSLIGQPDRPSFSIHFRKDLRLAGHRHFLSSRRFENSRNVEVVFNDLNGAPFDKLMALRKLEGQRLNPSMNSGQANGTSGTDFSIETLTPPSSLIPLPLSFEIPRSKPAPSRKIRSHFTTFSKGPNEWLQRFRLSASKDRFSLFVVIKSCSMFISRRCTV